MFTVLCKFLKQRSNSVIMKTKLHLLAAYNFDLQVKVLTKCQMDVLHAANILV